MHNFTQPIPNEQWFIESMPFHEDVVQIVEKSRLCGRYGVGIVLTATLFRNLEKRMRANEEKACGIEDNDVNSLSNASTYSCKHAKRTHVSPNKNLEHYINWYSTEA